MQCMLQGTPHCTHAPPAGPTFTAIHNPLFDMIRGMTTMRATAVLNIPRAVIALGHSVAASSEPAKNCYKRTRGTCSADKLPKMATSANTAAAAAAAANIC
jgi:hypothetical protein